jgi:hypothetical protein
MTERNPIPLAYAAPRLRTGVPIALKVVAWLFIVGGAISALQLIFKFLHGQFTIDTGPLGLFIGPGLLRLSRGWRTCALLVLWIGMIIAVIIGFAMLAAGGLTHVNLFGVDVGSAPIALGLVVDGLLSALLVWEYRVLVREDVRRLFGLPNRDH